MKNVSACLAEPCRSRKKMASVYLLRFLKMREKMKIVIVDDDILVSSALKTILEAGGEVK